MTTLTIEFNGNVYTIKQGRPVPGTSRHVWAIWLSGRYIGGFEASDVESARFQAAGKIEEREAKREA